MNIDLEMTKRTQEKKRMMRHVGNDQFHDKCMGGQSMDAVRSINHFFCFPKISYLELLVTYCNQVYVAENEIALVNLYCRNVQIDCCLFG
jgi:hypothetical protein